MAANESDEVITVRLTMAGVPAYWMAGLTRSLVTQKLAVHTAIYQRPHPDRGSQVMAEMHTQQRHLSAIAQRAFGVDSISAYPLDCDNMYKEWVLNATQV